MPFDMKTLTPDVAAATSSTVLFGAIGGQTDSQPIPIPINIIGTYTQANFSPAAGNPTASVGLAAVNGSATTVMRSDAAPPLSQAIVPTWTGQHTFNAQINLATIAAGTASFAPALNFGSTTAGMLDIRRIDQGANVYVALGNDGANLVRTTVVSNGGFTWSSSTSNANATLDTFITRPAAATIQLGNVDAAAPVAQIFQVQNVVAGTTNTSGVNWTFNGSVSTGTGTSGDIIFQTGGTGAGATSQNAEVTALTIKGATQQVILATNLRINVAPTVNGSASTTITSGADSSTNLGHRISFNLNGTTYWIPCGSVAF